MHKNALLSGVSAFGIVTTLAVALTLVLGAEPATARTKIKALHKEADRVSEPFGNAPKGPVQIFVSIDQQKLHLYSDGTHVADTSVATGVPRLPTPTGVFSVIQKQIFHRSNLYSDAPMPFMQRITWSGVALHEGENIGHPASHGCIRMPGEFAARLYKFTRIGARVIVARGELKPADFADPHLFVHRDIQAAVVPNPDAVKTAQSTDDAKISDAVSAAKSFDLGLRGSRANVATSFIVAASDDSSASKSDASSDAAKPNAAADTPKSDVSKSDSKSDASKSDALKSDAPKSDAPKSAADAAAPNLPPPLFATPEAPPAKPAEAVQPPVIKKTPIAIFISRKEQKIFVRQDFEPIFEEAITIEHPEQPMGTHVFTALELLSDNTTFRWNVVTMPGEAAKAAKPSRIVAEEDDRDYYYYDRFYVRHVVRHHKHPSDDQHVAAEQSSPQTPEQVLARINLPQDAIDFISQRMVPGSSLIVSDHGLGGETGEGTDFIVVTR
ncbi:MAG TPA: L,D-transpeptidase [Xanthobacteraceae bacterium]|nr:L,D-transpeptidase [Xanthobacteraceae bacterium]